MRTRGELPETDCERWEYSSATLNNGSAIGIYCCVLPHAVKPDTALAGTPQGLEAQREQSAAPSMDNAQFAFVRTSPITALRDNAEDFIRSSPNLM